MVFLPENLVTVTESGTSRFTSVMGKQEKQSKLSSEIQEINFAHALRQDCGAAYKILAYARVAQNWSFQCPRKLLSMLPMPKKPALL